MQPDEYKQLTAFRDLLQSTVDDLSNAGGQTSLASTATALAERWQTADDGFAKILADIGGKARMMPFAQVRPIVTTIVEHLNGQLSEVKQRLAE